MVCCLATSNPHGRSQGRIGRILLILPNLSIGKGTFQSLRLDGISYIMAIIFTAELVSFLFRLPAVISSLDLQFLEWFVPASTSCNHRLLAGQFFARIKESTGLIESEFLYNIRTSIHREPILLFLPIHQNEWSFNNITTSTTPS